ncbi:MAG: PilZ domain-containing protein [Deltaproteobacteria bacterium]|nr:PilZ domain-containing protein [Deltaproteobacteria bacterium]
MFIMPEGIGVLSNMRPRVTENTCPRCLCKFYTISAGREINCPFCGFSLRLSDIEKRAESRALIQRPCDLHRGGYSLSGQTVDISKGGICVKLGVDFRYDKGDTIRVVIKDFEIDTEAKVVWIKKFDSFICKAGLRFLNQPL